MTSKSSPEALAKARLWKKNNAERVKAMRKAYYAKNKEWERATNEAWKKANPETYKEGKRKSDAKYREENLEKIQSYYASKEFKKIKNEKARDRYRKDLQYRKEKILRALVTQALSLYGHRKDKKCPADKLMGCTAYELTKKMEKKFSKGMTWENIHLDHIIPCCAFDLTKESEQLKCFHYSNLQPLFAKDNYKKHHEYARAAGGIKALLKNKPKPGRE